MFKKILLSKVGGNIMLMRVDVDTKIIEYTLNGVDWIQPLLAEATGSSAGIMSASDKTKLAGLGSSVAPGTIMDFSGAVETIPSGFFLCNAADVSRTTYANLFGVIGEKFGFGDGSTTFTLPKFYPSFKNQVAWDADSRSCVQCAKLGNDLFYCTGKGTLGDVYKQTNATGAFVALGLANENWKGLVAHGSDLYVCSDSYNSSSGQIYKQTGGAGDFVSLAQESRRWTGMYSVGEDVYCGTVNGSLYKQTGGVGDFAEFIPTISTVTFNGLASFNGDMYACGTSYNSTADIYQQTGGIGSFVPLGTSKNWSALFVCEDCLYAIEEVTGNLYRRTSESPAFVLCDYGFGIPGRSIFDSSANCFYTANGAYGLQRSNKILKLIKY